MTINTGGKKQLQKQCWGNHDILIISHNKSWWHSRYGTRQSYQRLRQETIWFSPVSDRYNGNAGSFEAPVNIDLAMPQQRKGRLSQYSCNQLELHYSRPPSMCLKPSVAQRESGWFRLVTAFWKVAHYCQPQPSLMPLPDVDSTLRWRGFLLFLAAIFLNLRDGNCQPVIWLIGMDD